MQPIHPLHTLVEQTYRAEASRILGALIAAYGDFDLAEEALHDACAAALAHWPVEGAPRNPAAWLTTVARRKALDRLRRDQAFARARATLAADFDERAPEPEETDIFPDERLKLIFTCCHPALAPEAQLALTLRALGGLTTAEIAHAFLVPVATMNQRLTRAKAKIRVAAIPFRLPAAADLPERLDTVRRVLYLIFNEGYAATAGDALVRQDLCAEAIRLTRLLVRLLAREPTLTVDGETLGLLALLLLHDSRRHARVDAAGDLVLLEDQDRARWDQGQIAEGLALLERAGALGAAGPYQLQAAIVAEHARAATAAETRWPRIVRLYAELLDVAPSPVVALNHAVAVGMAFGPHVGLRLLDGLAEDGDLDDYHWFHAARADLQRRAGAPAAAADAYRAALARCQNGAERAFLTRRLSELTIGD